MRALVAVAAAALAVLAPATPAAAATASAAPASTPCVAYRLDDPRIDEASGLGVGLRSPGIDYVQNDSGDTARFFAIDAATGRTAATVTVPGASNVDWEDLAVAPAPVGSPVPGRSSVWLADIGDNDAVRGEIRVYRVDEPTIATGARDRTVTAARPDVWRLRYPDGATDAESLAVTPTGTAYVLTKSVGGAVVYRLPARPDPDHVQTLVRVATISFQPHGTAGPIGLLGSLTATGATVSADGSLLAVRTYSDAYVWRVHDGDVAAALAPGAPAPVRVDLPAQPQGEGIAFGGDTTLLVDSEGVGTPVYTVPMPASVTGPVGRTPSIDPNALASSLNHGSLPLRFDRTHAASGNGGPAAWVWTLIGVGAGVAVLGVAVATRARGRRAR